MIDERCAVDVGVHPGPFWRSGETQVCDRHKSHFDERDDLGPFEWELVDDPQPVERRREAKPDLEPSPTAGGRTVELLRCGMSTNRAFKIGDVVANVRGVSLYIGDERQPGLQEVQLEDRGRLDGSALRVLTFTVRNRGDETETWPILPAGPADVRVVVAHPHTGAEIARWELPNGGVSRVSSETPPGTALKATIRFEAVVPERPAPTVAAPLQSPAERAAAAAGDPSTGNDRLSGPEVVALAQVLSHIDGQEIPDWMRSSVELLRPLAAIRFEPHLTVDEVLARASGIGPTSPQFASGNGLSVPMIAYTAAEGRNHAGHRAQVVAYGAVSTIQELRIGDFEAWLDENPEVTPTEALNKVRDLASLHLLDLEPVPLEGMPANLLVVVVGSGAREQVYTYLDTSKAP